MAGWDATAQAVHGVATFSDLTIDQAGDEYSLTATSNSISTTTNSFTVNPGAATQLVISAPEDVLAGPASSNNGVSDVVVNAEDPYGNIDPNFDGEVTLALATNASDTALSGGSIAFAVQGEADFEPVFSLPGNDLTLEATTPGLAPGVSSPFNVTSDELEVSVEPPSFVAAGNEFTIAVTAENSSGSVDPSFNGNVTVSLPGARAASLGGTLTVSALNGTATFSNLTLTEPGNYTLSVNSDGVAGTETSPFVVTAAPASRLVVTGQPPEDVTTGAVFPITVTAEDSYGNVDTSFSGSITIALSDNPGAPLSVAP